MYAMMTGNPPSRHHSHIWNISRMNGKDFSAGLREIVGDMLEDEPQKRPDAFRLVDKVDEGYRRWRVTTQEGLEFVAVEDEVLATRIGIERV